MLIADRTRPTYHLLSPMAGGHVADPNFAFFWKGLYHLFFVCPGGFAHVSSVDMVHWRRHPQLPFRGLSDTVFVNREGRPTLITKHDTIAHERIGAHTAICCHLINQAYYHRQKMLWDTETHSFRNDTGNPAWLTRDYREPYRV